MNILEELQEVVTKNSYTSNFDFESCEIEKEDIEFIKNHEQKLRKRFMGISESLYDICIMLNQVSKKFKKSRDFMAWYQANGLTKDNISEFNKRFILFQEFKDKKDFIASLSNQSVKFLTHKNVNIETREKIISEGIKKAEDIKSILNSSTQGVIEYKEKNKSFVNLKRFKKITKKIYKVKDGKELNIYKSDIELLEKEIKQMKQAVKDKEKEWENKDNFKLM